MIKHGYSPTAGEYTAESSFIEPYYNRQERDDYQTDDELTLAALDTLMNADVPINGLHLTTNNGIIQIRGKIPHKNVQRKIRELLEPMLGAIGIELELEVATPKESEAAE